MPLAASIYWHLPVLIAVFSFVYSATRFDRWDLIRREWLLWVRNMVMFLGGIAAVLTVLGYFI